jgi:hypothetical protein
VPHLKRAEYDTIVDRKGTSAENVQMGDSPRGSPGPLWDAALSAKVTTGGLKAPRWKVGYCLLWIDGPWGLLSRLHLTSMLRSLG